MPRWNPSVTGKREASVSVLEMNVQEWSPVCLRLMNGRLQSMGSLRVGHDFATSLSLFTLMQEMATHSSVLAWRIPGTGEPGGLPSMGSHRVGHD